MNVTQLQEMVKDDVRRGLLYALEELSFEFTGPFADKGALIDVDGRYAVVQWVYTGIDNIWRPEKGRGGFNGMWPTGKQIRVPGLTVIDTEPEPSDWLFHRHIDWNEVNSQLGGSRGRSSSAQPIKDPRDAIGGPTSRSRA